MSKIRSVGNSTGQKRTPEYFNFFTIARKKLEETTDQERHNRQANCSSYLSLCNKSQQNLMS